MIDEKEYRKIADEAIDYLAEKGHKAYIEGNKEVKNAYLDAMMLIDKMYIKLGMKSRFEY